MKKTKTIYISPIEVTEPIVLKDHSTMVGYPGYAVLTEIEYNRFERMIVRVWRKIRGLRRTEDIL